MRVTALVLVLLALALPRAARAALALASAARAIHPESFALLGLPLRDRLARAPPGPRRAGAGARLDAQ
eukprot:3522405-Alexandrium_andersonii.AAC.1